MIERAVHHVTENVYQKNKNKPKVKQHVYNIPCFGQYTPPPPKKNDNNKSKVGHLKKKKQQPTWAEGVDLVNQPQTQEEKYSTACHRCHFEDRDVPALGREVPPPMLPCMTIIVFTRQFPKQLVDFR